MDDKQQRSLTVRDTDVQGAIKRFCGNEALYVSCLQMFLEDTTIEDLKRAIEAQSWDEAFTAAHALKGLAGNMGFVPLMHSTGQLVVLIRGGRLQEINDCVMQINSNYRDITDAIRDNFTLRN